jgi:hypothetical protein
MNARWILVAFCLGLPMVSPPRAFSQLNILDIAEKESAGAKEARLKWINEAHGRIDKERQELVKEREALSEVLPDPIKPRFVTPAAAREEVRAKLRANSWVFQNDPNFRAAIMKGDGLNALLRVFGPLAHYRRLRAQANPSSATFDSLKDKITLDDVRHYRMSPATSAGSKVVVRLNQMPLELEWPIIVLQHWRSDTQSLQKLRDEFVALLGSGASQAQTELFLRTAEDFDKAIENLQAKINAKRSYTPHDPALKDATKRMQIHRDLLDAIRYLETVRATAERFKSSPSDYKVREFPGGTIEEFLDFAYTHGMIFGESRRGDEEHYFKLVRHMQDYAQDIQIVEDWKSDIDKRIAELDDTDKKLLTRASEQ